MRRLIPAIAAVALLVTAALPVAAAKPTITVNAISESGIDPFASADCGFPVSFSVTGESRERAWFDANDVLRVVFTVNVHVEYTANGRTLRGIDAGMDTGFIEPDGTASIAIHGSVGMVKVPGHGPVFGAAGRLVLMFTPVLDGAGNPVLDEDGFPIFDVDVISESGVVGSGDIEAFCGYLAG